MRQKLFLSVIALLACVSLFAQHVTETEALQKAQAFMCERSEATGVHRAQRKMPRFSKVVENDALYIFNVEDNGGFVIVSGDERLPAVLGYSLTGCYDSENVPANMQLWLEGYAAQVRYVQTHDNTRLLERRSITGPAISPLLDCEWDQGTPFNDNCPIAFGMRTLTGCVATAMAQIMYYYQWPQQTRFPIHGYPITDKNITVEDIPVNTIEWGKMLPRYAEDYSSEQADAVARLMQMCGTAVRTNYGPDESGAYVAKVVKVLPQYFGYDMHVSLVNASNFEPEAWTQLMYDELAASRPIFYSGTNNKSGHSFVVDGYDASNYFHINWGWGLGFNGYFLLTALPDFNNDQSAIIGIQPSTTNIRDAYGVLENGTMTLYYDTKKNERSGQIFEDLVTSLSGTFDCANSFEDEILSCPSSPEMTACVIDSSFADYKLESAACFFYNCDHLKTITGLNRLNLSQVIDMSGMFCNCSELESIDFNGLNTSRVRSTSWMFQNCTSLKDINLSAFNTENVVDMQGMFYNCSSLEQLDLSNFNTEETELMLYMFTDCSNLKSINLSSFNTKKLLSMFAMFRNCSSLTELDVSGFNTENVIDMAYVFRYCSSLKNLDLSHFKTQEVTQMAGMFEGCSALESLDLSSFNTENVSLMFDMFMECSSLKTLDVSNFNTSNVVNMERMFDCCSSLEKLDLSSFNTEKVTSMFYLFRYCTSLKRLDISNFNTSNVTNMWSMFEACSSLESLDLSNFNTENVTTMYGMFSYCHLKELDLSSFNTSKVTNMDRLLFMSMALETLYVGEGWNTDNVEEGEPFYGCEKLVGEKGTKWSEHHIGVDYAHVDGGPENPGYLSDKSHLIDDSVSINKYKLIYIVDGIVYKSYEMECGALITAENAPTREGYTFSGWSEIPETMPAHDVKVNGTFIINKYLVTYMYGEQVLRTDSIAYGEVIPLPEIIEIGTDNPLKWMDVPETMPAHDIIIHADMTDYISELNDIPALFMVNNGTLYILDAPEGANITVYDTSGRKLGYTTSTKGKVKMTIPLTDSNVIVRVGNMAIKVKIK